MKIAAALSFACGFASLSLEILWVRLYGFTKFSTPSAFGFVLCLYLIGIALGAALGARACRHTDDAGLWKASIAALLLSSLLAPLLAAAFVAASVAGMDDVLLDLATIVPTAAVLSFVFPIAHHLGTERGGASRGQRFARVYTANVTGAALGPLVTGYVLLDHLSLQQAFLLLGGLQAVAALALVAALRPKRTGRAFVAAGLVGATALGLAAATVDPHAMLRHSPLAQPAATVVENRHGVVTILAGENGDDVVLGGNVYDGRTNLDPVRNSNGLERPLLAAVLHPAPRRVLVVGLSIGSWLAVVREFPGIESIDVIEVNPGYLEAIRAYPPQADALRDPRVRVAVDDARRWLRNRPDRVYDVIVMNTTVHWRANASLLLSRELLQQMKLHMAPGAVLAFNATGSGDAFLTASTVFRHAYRYVNFIYASDTDFRPQKDSARAHRVYRELRLRGDPLFPEGSPQVDKFLAIPFRDLATEQRLSGRPLEIVTDDNMLTEFRYGRRLYSYFYFLDDPFAAPVP